MLNKISKSKVSKHMHGFIQNCTHPVHTNAPFNLMQVKAKQTHINIRTRMITHTRMPSSSAHTIIIVKVEKNKRYLKSYHWQLEWTTSICCLCIADGRQCERMIGQRRTTVPSLYSWWQCRMMGQPQSAAPSLNRRWQAAGDFVITSK